MITLDQWKEAGDNKTLLWAFDYGKAISFNAWHVYVKWFSDKSVKLVGAAGEFDLNDVYVDKNECLKRCVEYYQELLTKE